MPEGVMVDSLNRAVFQPMWGTAFVASSKRSMGSGMIPRPLMEGASVEDAKRTCKPMHMPKYGFPDSIYRRSGSNSPRAARCSIAVWNAPTPGKMSFYTHKCLIMVITCERSIWLTDARSKSEADSIHSKPYPSFLSEFARL